MTNVNMTHCDVTVANRVLCESFQHIPVFFASSCCPFILLLFEKYFLKIQNFVFFSQSQTIKRLILWNAIGIFIRRDTDFNVQYGTT